MRHFASHRQFPALISELLDQLQGYCPLSSPGPAPVLTPSEEYLQTENDIHQCVYKLLGTTLFRQNKEYVRRQFVYCLLQVRRLLFFSAGGLTLTGGRTAHAAPRIIGPAAGRPTRQ